LPGSIVVIGKVIRVLKAATRSCPLFGIRRLSLYSSTTVSRPQSHLPWPAPANVYLYPHLPLRSIARSGFRERRICVCLPWFNRINGLAARQRQSKLYESYEYSRVRVQVIGHLVQVESSMGGMSAPEISVPANIMPGRSANEIFGCRTLVGAGGRLRPSYIGNTQYSKILLLFEPPCRQATKWRPNYVFRTASA
jgi:hypothetical protein